MIAAALAGCGTTGSSSSSSSSSMIVSGKTLTIYLSQPRGLAANPNLQDVFRAEQLAFSQDSGQVSRYKLRLQPLNGAVLSDNARIAIQDTSAIAYLGELPPGTSQETVGITQSQDLLELSPTDTGTMTSDDYESGASYPHNYMRVAGDAGAEAAALVGEMKALGGGGVYVADDGSTYGKAEAAAVRSAAASAGLNVTTSRSGAGAIFYGSDSPAQAARFFASAGAGGSGAKLFAPSALYTPAFASAAASLHEPLYVSVPGLLPGALRSADPSFLQKFKTAYAHAPGVSAVYGYEAMAGLIHMLAAAGTQAHNRTTVVKDAHKLKFGPTGFVIARLQGGSLVPWKAAPAAH